MPPHQYNPNTYPPPPHWGPPPPQKSNVGVVIAIVAGLAFVFLLFVGGIGAVFFLRAKSKATSAAATKQYWSDAASPIPVSSDDPIRGDRDALVTIVVFSDFQCPFCARLEPTLDSIRAQYGRDVRVVWKNEPLAFHVNAKPAAEAARGVFELAGNDAFWRFHDRCFANQMSLTPSNFESWARSEGVDARTFSSGVASHRWQLKVDEDTRLGARVGATGTPVSFVNGIKLSGAQPLSAFERLIDDELVKARAAVASGTPRERVYVERSIANAFAAPVPTGTAPSFPTEDTDAGKIFPVPVGTSPMRGPATALVTIVEFADYQCPFCKRAEVSLDRLRSDYPADVRIVFKQQPLSFHLRAEPAAELALEARAQHGESGYWMAHEKIYASQPALETADLLRIGRSMGLDEGRVSTAILTKKYKSSIDADAKLGTGFGATGTPTFFINGRKLTGAQPYEKFKQIVDEEIAKARAKLATGTPRSALYDEIVGLR